MKQCHWVIDFEFCVGREELKQTIVEINRMDYVFAGATQDGDTYTVFFRRPVNG